MQFSKIAAYFDSSTVIRILIGLLLIRIKLNSFRFILVSPAKRSLQSPFFAFTITRLLVGRFFCQTMVEVNKLFAFFMAFSAIRRENRQFPPRLTRSIYLL